MACLPECGVHRKGKVNGETLEKLLERVRACRACAGVLPLGPRPVLRAKASARLLIVGQAPGARVHETGIPWNDPSGDRLRAWMRVERETFYDDSRVAIIPAGLCYPGRYERGGDCRREKSARHCGSKPLAGTPCPMCPSSCCAANTRRRFIWGDRARSSLTETVRAWREYFPEYLPLPHPSFRNLLLDEEESLVREAGAACVAQTCPRVALKGQAHETGGRL